MIHAQNIKIVPFTLAAGTIATNVVATNNTTPVVVDTQFDGVRYNYAQVIIETIPYDGTNTTKFNTVKLGKSDTNSDFTDITAFLGTTNSVAGTSGFVIPGNPTTGRAGNKIVFNVDLTKHNSRYLGLTLASGSTVANANRFAANAHFSRVNETPASQIGNGVVVTD